MATIKQQIKSAVVSAVTTAANDDIKLVALGTNYLLCKDCPMLNSCDKNCAKVLYNAIKES